MFTFWAILYFSWQRLVSECKLYLSYLNISHIFTYSEGQMTYNTFITDKATIIWHFQLCMYGWVHANSISVMIAYEKMICSHKSFTLALDTRLLYHTSLHSNALFQFSAVWIVYMEHGLTRKKKSTLVSILGNQTKHMLL